MPLPPDVHGESVENVDVAIIGAGWYGLVAASTYLKLRPTANLVIIDSESTVGGVWSKERLYPNLVAQVKLGLFNYTGIPMPAQGKTGSDLVTGNMIHDYLVRYAQDHHLLRRIRFNTHVEHVIRCPRGWRLQVKDSATPVETEKLLVATGVTSVPSMPSIKEDSVTIPIIHSRDLGVSFKKLETGEVRTVVVVGAAKSAYDAVYLLISMGKQVKWIIRPDGAGPLAILPTKLLGHFNSIAVASTRLMNSLSPSILQTKGFLYSFFQKSKLGRWCVGIFWDFATDLSNRHAGYDKGNHVAGLRPEIDGKSVFYANSGLGVVTQPDFWSTIHHGEVEILRENLDSIKQNTVMLQSGKSMQVDYVVMCTGWGDHFKMFDSHTKAELGLPLFQQESGLDMPIENVSWTKHDIEADRTIDEKLPFLAKTPLLKNPMVNIVNPLRQWRLYRRSIPFESAIKGDRSIAILGQIHTVQTPLVAEMQSFWSILFLLGEIEMPGQQEIAREISEWNAWTRKRYLSQGQKFPYSLYDFLPYIDALCKDLGINSKRKSNPLAELFSPYRPEDFNGFINEYLANHKDQHRAAADSSL